MKIERVVIESVDNGFIVTAEDGVTVWLNWQDMLTHASKKLGMDNEYGILFARKDKLNRSE